MSRSPRWTICGLSRSSAERSATPATTSSGTRSNLPHPPADDRQLPDLSFAFYDRWSSSTMSPRRCSSVVLVRTKGVEDLAALYRAVPAPPGGSDSAVGYVPSRDWSCTTSLRAAVHALTYQSNFEREAFEQAVSRCVEYIRAGDIFQVVISQRLQVEIQRGSVRDLPHAAGDQSQPVHVLPADAAMPHWWAVRRKSCVA